MGQDISKASHRTVVLKSRDEIEQFGDEKEGKLYYNKDIM